MTGRNIISACDYLLSQVIGQRYQVLKSNPGPTSRSLKPRSLLLRVFSASTEVRVPLGAALCIEYSVSLLMFELLHGRLPPEES